MGDIVQFKAARRGVSAPDAAATGASAEIMFFTGVRYERREDEASAQSPAPGSASKSAPGKNSPGENSPSHGGAGTRKPRKRA